MTGLTVKLYILNKTEEKGINAMKKAEQKTGTMPSSFSVIGLQTRFSNNNIFSSLAGLYLLYKNSRPGMPTESWEIPEDLTGEPGEGKVWEGSLAGI